MSGVVPYLDLARQHASLREELLAAFTGVLDDGAFVGGPRVAEFERAFARLCGAPHAIGVANGTDALKLALRAAGLRPGDEVVVPAYTFVASAGAVIDAGCKPVLADVRADTALLDAADVARKLGPRTRAVMLVHLFGLPCDPQPFRDLLDEAGRRDVVLLEDAAQAHGAALRGTPTGSLTEIAGFSFYPTKNLGALGDAGAVTTSRADWADLLRSLADHGRPNDPARRGEHLRPGVNSRLSGLQAAALSVKLDRLPRWNDRRAEIAARYVTVLESRDGVRLQETPPGHAHVRHVFALRHARRDELAAALAARGVQARAQYPQPLHQLPALESLGGRAGDFPQAEAWAREMLALPMFPELTDEEVQRVVDALPPALDHVRG